MGDNGDESNITKKKANLFWSPIEGGLSPESKNSLKSRKTKGKEKEGGQKNIEGVVIEGLAEMVKNGLGGFLILKRLVSFVQEENGGKSG